MRWRRADCEICGRRQERQVQSYVEDANARRQFEDAASLQMSLDELRGEIDRLRAQIDQ